MSRALFASAVWIALATLKPREPSRCPYCPDRPQKHWVKWGSYRRWAPGRHQKLRVQCYRCPFARRWFSLLPDGLLPYRYHTATRTLGLLDAMIVREAPVSRLARLRRVAASTLRWIKAAFLRARQVLRLPDHEGQLSPGDFLRRLAGMGVEAVRALFMAWKEGEPKHSILGLYAR